MASREEVLQQLIEMSHWLGVESRGLVILGEGNTSARVSDETFFVKASGTQLGTITAEGLVEVNAPKVLKMLEGPELTDDHIKANLEDATVGQTKFLPSIETVFHAYLLTIPGVNFVGHTHPVSVLGILCSPYWRKLTKGGLFPDEIVCCGIAPAYVEYNDPGVSLARAIRKAVEDYIKQYQTRPKAILMQNHGLIALGATAKEVESITQMWDKTAKVLAETHAFGGPNYMSKKHVDRIYTRPDEEQRKKLIEGQ
jgi:rhamnose utilization protein RhaD (predicted bifunctional aldolase and dehydrogenase)